MSENKQEYRNPWPLFLMRATEFVGVLAALAVFGYDFLVEKPRDRAVRTASLQAQIAQLHSLQNGEGLYAIAANLEILIKEKVPLRGFDLSGIRVIDGNFDGANFSGTNLKNAVFHGTSLVGANFKGANLTNTHFEGTSLENANFSQSKLKFADFRYVSLVSADFSLADLDSAIILYSYLNKSTIFRMTNVINAKFYLLNSSPIVSEKTLSTKSALTKEEAQELLDIKDFCIFGTPQKDTSGAFDNKDMQICGFEWISTHNVPI